MSSTKKRWHYPRNCHKHGCKCVVTTIANGIAGTSNGTKVKIYDDSKCRCGRDGKGKAS